MGTNGWEFGQTLRMLRLRAGLSQEELAQRSELAARTVARIERGHSRRPHPRSLRRLAEALELNEAELYEFIAGEGFVTTALGGRGRPRPEGQ